jgi:hypothetical protein
MYKIISFCIAVFACWCTAAGQISCTNAIHRTLTNYTNGLPNDSLFFICNGQTATLVATPPSGTPGWNFTWQQFSAAGNNWNPLTVSNNVPSSQLNNLQPGGYRVIITDGSSVNVGEYIVWICRVNVNPTVNVLPIAAGCSNVQLQAQVNAGTITPYYNPPIINNNPSNSLIIGPGTSIQICYTGTHTYISDLGFFLVGPASCGSPTILLSPNPASNGQYIFCNSSQNFTNLCFSNQSTAIFNPCSPGTYSGTYGGYGPGGGTMINWTALNGCDASQPGWAVQVYDCVLTDTGILTGANITFNGTSVGGDPISYSYSSPSGFSSAIADNSCTPSSASIFNVPSAPAQQITFPLTYQWTADPPFTIPNSTSSLNIQLNPGPTVDTQFTLTLTGTHPGAICSGTSTDTELFDYLPPVTPALSAPATMLCLFDDPITLTTSIGGGTWNGPGTTASTGVFNPATAGVGTHTVNYSMSGNCTPPASIAIEVVDNPIITITPVQGLCSSSPDVTLQATPAGGTWSGAGITSSDIFHPSAAGSGNHTLYYQLGGSCPSIDSITVVVEESIQPTITVPNEICINSNNITFNSAPVGGTWSGTIVSSSGQFVAPTSAGTYTVSYGFNSACSNPASATIEVVEQTSVSITPVLGICTNTTSFNLNASQTGGTWSGDGIENSTTGVFNPSIAGSGPHVVTYTIPGTCPAVGQTTINVAPFVQPVITAPATLCSNDLPVTLSASPAGGTWSGVGITSNGTFDPSTSGNGNAEVTYQITGTCPASTSSTIQVNATPTVSISGNNTICPGEVTTLTGSGASQYNWSPNTGLSSPQNVTTNASPNGTTTYTLTGTTNGCSSSTQFLLTVNPLPVIVVSGLLNICSGDTTMLLATGADTYNWTPSSGLSSTNIGQPEAAPLVTTTYTVTGTNSHGCSNTASVDVEVFHVNFEANPTEGTAPLSVDFTNLSGGISANWNFGDGESYISFNPNEIVNHMYTDMGLFEAVLSITYPSIVCSSTQEILVYANSEILLVPNIVTADGNGANDQFRISLVGMKSLDVQIFDRWGKNIGALKGPEDSWNPRDHGDGIYYYTLKAEGLDKKIFERSGYFHVTR